MLARLVWAPVCGLVAGGIAWAVVRVGLETADQLSSVIGGAAGLVGLAVSLLTLRSPAPARPAAAAAGGGGEGGRWVRDAAAHDSYRAPAVPAPVRGRDSQLADIEQMAAGRDGGLVVVCGTGGLGKTTLAAQAAQQAEAQGRAVFWVRWQDDAARLAHDLTRIVKELGLAESRLQDAQSGQAALVDVVWEHLAAVRGWMIVIDNVDTPNRLGPGSEPPGSYRGWVRPDGAGLLVVTTRDGAPDTWGPRARLVPLEPLADDASGQVLRDAAPRAGTAEEAAALGERLGGLPLALETAGRYLANPTSRFRTFTAYRHALDEEFGDLVGAEHPQAADPEVARTVVRHTFDLSLTQLHSEGYTLARPTLYLLALLAPAPVPRTLLTPALLTDATGRRVTAAELDAALAGLHQYGLINTPGETLAVGQVVLHPVVHDVIALTAPPGTDRTTCYAALDAHLTQTVHDTTAAGRAGWPTARLLAAHLPPLLDRTSDADFTTTRDLLDSLAYTLRNAGAATEEHLLRRCVLDAETHQHGPDHPDTLASRNNSATSLNALGRHEEAADLHRQTLTDYERVLGRGHPDALNSRNNLASSLRELGRCREAADLDQQTFTDRERVLGPDHPDALASRNNLASSLRELGRCREAADLDQQTFTDRERVLGPDHPDALASRNNLASSLRELGRCREAADLDRQTLTDRERVLGPDHPDALASRNNLASSLRELGRCQEAADLRRQTLADYERFLGRDHPRTLASWNNLATSLYALGRCREAADLDRQTLTDRERVLGPDHPDTLASRNNLAEARAAAAYTERRRWPWQRTRP
ncbi:tetratricopeptide repeat-containing protein [Streptomyces sp. WAC 06738]|uniref:tetratricopeptide repeat protein n=1 Tax=Streptomyces sp. WAC 06738 TaxID=2203210 RepID=UPI000F6B84B3|nr:tetratricopeptide repeat protein [Streptomyces sp. WAC 06738]AZM48783.1 tetratricopeptide repeat-containing protein [Streptomyces sp. WAC 06738]